MWVLSGAGSDEATASLGQGMVCHSAQPVHASPLCLWVCYSSHINTHSACRGTKLPPDGIVCATLNAPSFFMEALMRKWAVHGSLPEYPAACRSVAIGSGAQTSKLNPLLLQQPVINTALNGTTHPTASPAARWTRCIRKYLEWCPVCHGPLSYKGRACGE